MKCYTSKIRIISVNGKLEVCHGNLIQYWNNKVTSLEPSASKKKKRTCQPCRFYNYLIKERCKRVLHTLVFFRFIRAFFTLQECDFKSGKIL